MGAQLQAHPSFFFSSEEGSTSCLRTLDSLIKKCLMQKTIVVTNMGRHMTPNCVLLETLIFVVCFFICLFHRNP